MPIETNERLKALLRESRITAVTLDTNIFDGQQLNLHSAALKAIRSLKDIPFAFILSGTVMREVEGHLIRTMEETLRSTKKALGDALCAFDTTHPTRDDLLNQVTGGHIPANVAEVRIRDFLAESGCEVLNDTSLVDVETLFGAYFDRRPPFSHGKKTEFPDALALYTLEKAATVRNTALLVVSQDRDWREFCATSNLLYLVPSIQKALALINDTPIGLRRTVTNWFADGQDGRSEVATIISHRLETLDVGANAHTSSGEVETFVWAPEVRSIEWPAEPDIDIIETEEVDEGTFRAVVSVPVVIALRFNIELTFSLWDSVDRESVGMGGRTIEVDREEDARVTVTLDLRRIGENDEEVELIESELDINSEELDLGEVDVFEAKDYYD